MESGDEVLSVSVNKSGLLSIEVTKEYGDSTVSKILIWYKMQAVKSPYGELYH